MWGPSRSRSSYMAEISSRIAATSDAAGSSSMGTTRNVTSMAPTLLERLRRLEPLRLDALALSSQLLKLGVQRRQLAMVGRAGRHRLVQLGLARLELLHLALQPT